MNARIAPPGELNYPGIGSTEHGQAPEGFPCLVSQAYLGDGLGHRTGAWRRES